MIWSNEWAPLDAAMSLSLHFRGLRRVPVRPVVKGETLWHSIQHYR